MADLMFVQGSKPGHSLGDVNEIPGFEHYVQIGFSIFQNLGHVHNIGFVPCAILAGLFARDPDMVDVGRYQEATRPQDCLA